ncbi:MAG: MutS-related protein [Janthinobacterium lividum]
MNQPLYDQNQLPADFYTTRLGACRLESKQRRRQHVLFGYARLGWAALFLLLAWMVFGRHLLPWQWLLLPWVGFAVTARFHGRVLAAGARANQVATWYESGLGRMENRWTEMRQRSTRLDSSTSLFASDLDIFGTASLFQLLCTARTSIGEDELAAWLLQPAPAHEVLARQAAVAELRHHTALREEFAAAPGPDLLSIDRPALVRWGEEAKPVIPPLLKWLAPVLVLLTVAAVVRWATAGTPLALILMILVDGSLTFLLQSRVKPLFAEAQAASGEMALLARLFEAVERQTFEAASLKSAQVKLHRETQAASKAIRRLASLTTLIEQRTNYFVRILDTPLLYSVQLAVRMQQWHRTHGTQLRAWLEALGTFEALLALSAYHFEHPADPFPELVSGAATFVADQLGHPLLPEAVCVRNSVSLNQDTHLLLISGSNMSGKSTLLRCVGTAAVMAMAGAPVRARGLRLSGLHIAASIQVSDSLQSGRSRFYAEILRLRAVCALAGEKPPILFLLDELLAGTNSSDRLVGATGVVRQLLATGAIGLLSTHDLALTGIGGLETGKIRNAHFEDQVVGDRIEFDHLLRDGTVTRSNGLALMRLIGLDV